MPRYLPVNDSNTVPGSILIVEVGTVNTPDKLAPGKAQHDLYCWTAIAARMEGGRWTREKLKHGSTAQQFWQFVEYARQAGHPSTICGYCIDRSLSMLDFWGQLESGNMTLSLPPHPNAHKAKSRAAYQSMSKISSGILITAGPPTAVVCWTANRNKLTIVDSRNYLDVSQAELARLTGYDYRPDPAAGSPDSDWEETLELRVRSTAEFFKRMVCWQNRQELGMFALTVTSLGMAAFRHRFMRDKIALPDDQDTRDWERSGYFSGRVEALWCGKIRDGRYTPTRHVRNSGTLFDDQPSGTFHAVDARSFYASIDTFEELPCECTESHLSNSGVAAAPEEPLHEVMATVTIESLTDVYPVRANRGSYLARGRYVTTLCGPELVRAVRAGHVTRWHAWQRYRLAPVLRWYAEGLWAERVKSEVAGDLIIASLCKSLMARIHGKFLQRAHRWTLLPGRLAPAAWSHWRAIDVVTGQLREYRSIGWDVQIKDDAGDHKYCFPAIAAWVTSHGREYLRHWMQVAGLRQVLYVGCDSLIVTDIGLDNLTKAGIIWPDGIGSLRIVRSSPDIEIRGPNNYHHGDRQVVAGRSYSDLRIIANKWTASRWQGTEETFLRSDKTRLTSYPVHGDVDGYSAPGTVSPGGWIEPLSLTIKDQELCQTSE